MRKISNVLFYFGFIALLSGILAMMCHFRETGRLLSIISIVLLLLGIILIPFRSKYSLKQANYYTSPGLNSLLRAYKILVWTAIPLILIGSLLRMLHLDQNRYMSIAGTALFLIAVILLLIVSLARKQYVPVAAGDIDPAGFDKYVGIYSNEQLKMDITVTKNGLELSAQATGQSSFPLSPIKEHIFNYVPAGIVMEFHPDKNEFILIQRGGYFPFIKQ